MRNKKRGEAFWFAGYWKNGLTTVPRRVDFQKVFIMIAELQAGETWLLK